MINLGAERYFNFKRPLSLSLVLGPSGAGRAGGPRRFRAPEILFHPDLIGLEYPGSKKRVKFEVDVWMQSFADCGGIHELLATSINRADLDLRMTLFSQAWYPPPLASGLLSSQGYAKYSGHC